MIRKTVVITGAAGGIGSAIAREFARSGYNVALTYFRSSTKKLEKELSGFGVEVKSFYLDQSDEKCVEKCFKEIFASFDYVDAIIANSGICEKKGLLIDKKVSEIDKVLSTNLRGTIIVNREALKYLQRQRHGNIVNVSSIYGVSGGACEAVYSASKAGIIGLTKALASECAPIRVNAIAPGAIESPMTAGYTKDDREEIISKTPLGRFGTGEDVANLAVFLASDKASFITGECYSIAGGVVKF